MTSTLSHFWQLASSAKADRLGSAHALVQTLVPQRKGAPSSPAPRPKRPRKQTDDDEAAAASVVTDEEVQEAEAALTLSESADVAYAVKRLIKGLASHRESSRLGFSVALSELLARIHTFSAPYLIILVLAYSTPNSGKVKGQEERDLVFARLFGIHALVQSGILLNSTFAEKDDFQRAIDVLWTISKGKPWLRESAASVIVQAVEALAAATTVSWRAECLRWMADKVCSDRQVTADSIAVFMALRQASPDAFTSTHRLPHVASQELLSPANLRFLARALRDSDMQPQEEMTQSGKEGATGGRKSSLGASGSVKAHFVWDRILQQYTKVDEGKKATKTQRASFADVFRILVDDNLFSATSSHQKKSWGLQIVEQAAQTVDVKLVPEVFMPNVMRTLINQLGGKDRLLNKAAQKACVGVQQAARDRPEMAYDVILRLTGPHGSMRFDMLTGTKTIETILRYLSEADVRRYAAHLIELVCREEADGVRMSLFDQLLTLVRSTHIQTDESCTASILTFFAAHGLFALKEPLSGKVAPASECLKQAPQPAFTSSARASCRSRFLSCLSDLHAASITAEIAEVDWIARGQAIVKQLEQDTTHLEAVAPMTHTSFIRADEVNKRLQAAEKKAAKDGAQVKRITVFRSLLTAAVLYAQGSLLGESDALEIVDPLCDCAEQLLLVKANATTKKGKAADPDEPGPMELFVQCLSNALQPASAFLRGVATHAFDAFAEQMTRASMRLLIEQLGFNAQDEAEEGVDAEGEEMSDSVSVASATSDVSDEEDEEDDIDADFAAKVRHALMAGMAAGAKPEEEGAEDEDEDDAASDSDQSDFNDDQMMLIDDKLADVFREKFSARKAEDQAKKEEAAYHVRIVDLLDHFARQHGESELCIEMVLPLFSVALEKDKTSDVLRQRVTTVLQKSILKGKSWPTGVAAEQVTEPLDAVHKMACTVLPPAHYALTSAANIYLTRSSCGAATPDAVRAVYATTLQDFMERKANNLKPSFLIDAFARFPRLGFALRKELLDAAAGPQTSSQHSFRQLQALEMLRTVVTHLSAQYGAAAADGKADSIERDALDATLRALAVLTLQRARQDSLRIKEVLKVGLHLVRITKKWSEVRTGGKEHVDDAFVGRTWPVEEVQGAIDALATTNALPNSTSLQSLLKQMLALLGAKPVKAAAEASPQQKGSKRASPPVAVHDKKKASKKSKKA